MLRLPHLTLPWLAVVVALSIVTSAQQPMRGQYRVKPFKVVGNVYFVGLSDNTSYLITTPQGHILLDPTFDAAAPDIRRSIEELGFKLQDVKILLNFHAHTDHVGGLATFKALTGAQVVEMAEDAASLADGGKSDFRNTNGREMWTPVRPDRIIHDGDSVQLGGVTLVAHLTPGHTKGNTTWTTVAEENGRKYNVAILGGMRMNTGVALVNNPQYPNAVEDFERGFRTLKALPCDIFLVSHGHMFDLDTRLARLEKGGANPFLDPDGYRAYIAEYEAAFLKQVQVERAGGPPNPVNPPPLGPCPTDGRACYPR